MGQGRTHAQFGRAPMRRLLPRGAHPSNDQLQVSFHFLVSTKRFTS